MTVREFTSPIPGNRSIPKNSASPDHLEKAGTGFREGDSWQSPACCESLSSRPHAPSGLQEEVYSQGEHGRKLAVKPHGLDVVQRGKKAGPQEITYREQLASSE